VPAGCSVLASVLQARSSVVRARLADRLWALAPGRRKQLGLCVRSFTLLTQLVLPAAWNGRWASLAFKSAAGLICTKEFLIWRWLIAVQNPSRVSYSTLEFKCHQEVSKPYDNSSHSRCIMGAESTTVACGLKWQGQDPSCSRCELVSGWSQSGASPCALHNWGHPFGQGFTFLWNAQRALCQTSLFCFDSVLCC